MQLVLLVALLLVYFISSFAAQQVWKNSYSILGFKEYNNITDVDPGNSVMAVFVDTTAQYQRFDATNSLTGHIVSTTVTFSEHLYYLNYPTDGFCVFEHLHPDQPNSAASARPLPFQDNWTQNNKNVTFVGKLGKCGFAGANSCNVYRLEKGSQQATGFAFALFNYFGDQFYSVLYMEDVNTKKPVQFQSDVEGIRTNFYVLDFTSMDTSFPPVTFTQNVHDSCH